MKIGEGFNRWRRALLAALAIGVGVCSVGQREAHAQCGIGWALGAGDGPGSYEICFDEARGKTVLFSGTTTFEWDGIEWTTVAVSGPPERGAGGLVYDPIGQQCLLFGGYSAAGARKDLWSWNGKAWTEMNLAPAEASGRGDFAMAFDRGRNRLVIHGGWPLSGALLTDTLEWNPSDNTWQRWATSPIGNRYAHRMAYDEVRGECILHGGYYFTNKNDTWRWNGDTWTLASTSGPARYVFGMTFDSARGQILLHGGTTCCAEVEYPQTWIWDGLGWSQCALQGPARGYMNIAYDRVRDVVVLPGGMGPTPTGRAYVPETWELAMSVQPEVLRVPTDFATIQEAVDAATDGATVLVSAGEYIESVNLRGKRLLVRSEKLGAAAVLAPDNQRSFVAVSGETSATRVIGFRLGRAGTLGGGAIVTNASPLFDSCVFDECKNGVGGGAMVSGGAPSFVACDFIRCYADQIVGFYGDGGGIRSVGGSITVDGCNFLDCQGPPHGDCFVQEGGSSVFRHCAFVQTLPGGFAQFYNASGSLTIEDSVFDGANGSSCIFGWAAWTVRRCAFRNMSSNSVMDGRFGQALIEQCSFEHCATAGPLFIQTYSLTYAISDSWFCDCTTPAFECCWTDLGGNNFDAKCPSQGSTVPTDYPTIQAAIDAAPATVPWTVNVLAGTYHESFRMLGKNVVVRGAANDGTILDGTGLTISIAQCVDGEPTTAGLENLVFRNGIVGSRFTPESTFTIGGAIYATNSAAHIRDCRFESCRADFGGAIYQYVGGVSWENCVFTDNIANVDGGGALIYNTTGIVQGCTFTGNQVGMAGPGSGSAIKVVGSNGEGESVVLQSCTITGNFAWDSGSAVELYEHSKYHPVVLHLIDTLISKNSSGDPLLAGAAGLRVLGGQSSCVVSGSTSICGNAPIDVDGPFLLEDPATVCGCFADITGDGVINGGDLGIVLSSWGAAAASGVGDVNHDGVVSSIDLALVLSAWGPCN